MADSTMAATTQPTPTKSSIGVADRTGHVVGDHAEDQRQADADREGDGHAGDVDGGDEQDVRQVEDDAADERRAQRGVVGLGQVVEEAAAGGAGAAEA